MSARRGAAPPSPALAQFRAARRNGGRRELVAVAAVAATAAVLTALALWVGSDRLSPAEVWGALFASGGAEAYVVQQLRAPRAAAALGVGAALGLSGAVFQSVARNVLASPDILGISLGASLAAVVTIAYVSSAGAVTVTAAFAGAVLATALVLGLSAGRGMSPFRIILVGIGMQLLCQAALTFVLARQGIDNIDQYTAWLVGSLNNRRWDDVAIVLVALVPLTVVLVVLVRRLRMLQLGDALALSVGVDARRSRLALLVTASALAAAAVCVAGPVAFVAFIAPPLARWLTGRSVSLPAAALLGAVLLLSADLLGRVAFGELTMPVGITMGLIGGPYLLYMIFRANRVGSGD